MKLLYKLYIPSSQESLIPIVYSTQDIIETLEKVQKCLPGSNILEELIIELKDMGGVAHTGGSIGKKKITLSSKYFMSIDSSRLKLEFLGVLCHELVHTIQYDGLGSADGGVIEGIADYGILNYFKKKVRLKVLGPAVHWTKTRGGNWNSGYSITAWFFDWIDSEITRDFVIKLNIIMKNREWEVGMIHEITGHDVDELWEKYQATLSE